MVKKHPKALGHKGYSDFKGEKQRQNSQVKRQKTAE